MADNIVRQLEQQLREQSMKTMDPNTQAAGDEQQTAPRALYHRSIMSAALAGLLEFSRKDQNIESLLAGAGTSDYAEQIFHQHFSQLEEKIRAYSGYDQGSPKQDFNFVLQQLIGIVGSRSGGDPQAAKDYLSSQRSNILSYLPGELHTGKFLDNNTIDDRTNKMHGPFSDFTHWIEQLFSTSDQ